MTRRAAAGALVALAALGATGCGSVWRQWVNDGASTHANEHVADGQGALEVLCQIPPQPWELAQAQPGQVIEDHLWLIPSEAVAAFGCEDAFRRAAGTRCDESGCHVLAVWHGQLDGNPYQPMRAPVDPPGRLPKE